MPSREKKGKSVFYASSVWPFHCSSSLAAHLQVQLMAVLLPVRTGASLCQAPRGALGVCCASGAAIPTVFHPFNPVNYCCSSNKTPKACSWNERSFQTTNMSVSIWKKKAFFFLCVCMSLVRPTFTCKHSASFAGQRPSTMQVKAQFM